MQLHSALIWLAGAKCNPFKSSCWQLDDAYSLTLLEGPEI